MSTRSHVTSVLIATSGFFLAMMLGGCPQLPGGDPNDGDPNDGGTTPDKPLHERVFTEIITDGFAATSDCMICHSDVARELMDRTHWKWEGTVTKVYDENDNLINPEHGKMDLINNFCIAVPGNEGRCSQCHPSYGWKNNSFDFSNADNVDCLICHDTTGTYKKHPSDNGGGGPPALSIDGELTVVTAAELQEVAYQVGSPTRANCGFCHFNAGGGDNVKQGSLSSDLVSPTFDMDVHMGSTATGGQDFSCQTCHQEQNHGFSGMVWHSVDEGGSKPNCTRCHGETKVHQADPLLSSVLNIHTTRVACETCHIPTFSRTMATKTAWYWDEAGEDRTDIPTQEGRATYDKKKGRFIWAKNVTPTYLWYNGTWTRKVVNVNDTYAQAGTEDDPVILSAPRGDINDDNAKIYPFKKMIGRQVVDTTHKRLMVPHLFGKATGDNPYWAKYDWDLSLQDGSAYTGQPYSGDYGFVNTVMYLRVSHEVAPASQAKVCEDCHGVSGFFEALGYAEDPFGT